MGVSFKIEFKVNGGWQHFLVNGAVSAFETLGQARDAAAFAHASWLGVELRIVRVIEEVVE